MDKKAQPPAPSGKKSSAGAPTAPAAPVETQLDFRIGKILECKPHPDADSLYIEMIDLGEATGPRQILSGLRNYIPQERMVGQDCIVVANLKPSALRGITSFGMVLCAKTDDKTKLEFVTGASGAKVGDRVTVLGEDWTSMPAADVVDAKKKGSAWIDVAAKLTTNDKYQLCYDGKVMGTAAGPCHTESIANVPVA